MTATKVTPATRAEVARLLECVPAGLSAASMAQISRLFLPDVETVLRELERLGDVGRKSMALRGQTIELWHRR